MVSNFFCEDASGSNGDGGNGDNGSLSGIQGAVDNIPKPGGGGEGNAASPSPNDNTGDANGGDGTTVTMVDLGGGMANLMAHGSWFGDGVQDSYNEDTGTTSWYASALSSVNRGGIFGKQLSATLSGNDAIIDAIWFTSGGGGGGGGDATNAQLKILEDALVGDSTSGLDGIYDKANTIATNTSLTQAGLSAVKGDVNIKSSDGTTIGATTNSLDIFVKGGSTGGNSLSVRPPVGGAFGVSSDGNLPISLEANNAGNLAVDIGAMSLGIGLGVYSAATAGVQVRNGMNTILNCEVSSNSFTSSVFIDEDANGSNPQTNTVIIAAPGAGSRLIIESYTITAAGSAATAYGNFLFSDGSVAGSETTGDMGILIAGRSSGTTSVSLTGSPSTPIGLAENAALKFTTTEGSGHIYIYGSIQFRTVEV